MAIVGATATGKSSVALGVARRLGGRVELVSVDSMQVYVGLDIGTAKPTLTEQREIPHHCIDLVEPTIDFTVADFRIASAHALATIAGRERCALLVGGTGLYHRVVIDDLDLPGEFPAVRESLEGESDTSALFDRLRSLDPAAAAKIEPGNRRRIVRALEVTVGAGRPFSSFGPGLDSYPATDVAQIGIRRPREVTAERVERRVHAMIDAGLLDEVRELHARGLSRTARQALGYKELIEHLEGRMSHDEAVERIIVRTRQFAVRQERWFRRDPRVRWIDVGDGPVDPVIDTVIDAFENA